MFNKKLLLVFSVLALGFTACPAPQSFGLGGTIIAPAGSDVKGTIIMACNIKTCTEPRSANAEVFTVDTTGLTAQFNIVLFAPGKYQVIAVNAAQGLIGVYKNPTDNSNTVEIAGFGSETKISITLVKGAVPAQAVDLFKTELLSP
jgi:hypothetical protein